MGESTGPGFPKLGRGLIVGGVLAALGVGLFIVLWQTLGGLGFAQAPRLFVAMCVPPAIIALLVGIYYLVARNRGDRGS